ncbi:MAG: c-type cytochrome [Chloroflexota bacterium]
MFKKLVFTALALLCLGVILGYSALNETSRTGEMAEAQKAESVEAGAAVYYEHCANCHGQNGRAEECISLLGEVMACAGRALNTPELLCDNQGVRLQAEGWQGTAEEYILSITTIGKSETGMPPFGAEYRYDQFNALADHQIQDVTAFILEYETWLSCTPALREISIGELFPTVESLPEGDGKEGEELFHITYGCSACHGDPLVEGTNAVGPWSGNFKNLDDRIEGYTAADYVYESILLPNAFISQDCPVGILCTSHSNTGQSNMPDDFGLRMTAQDISDVLAYLGIDASDSNHINVTQSLEN